MNFDNVNNTIKQYIRPVTVLVICAYGLYIRLLNLHGRDFWEDELIYFEQMRGTFWELLKNLKYYEFCTYLSGDIYLVYPFFKLAPFNKWVVAIPHIIITLLGFYILYLLCQKYLKSTWAYVLTFIAVCMNKTMIFHATEIRPYAVLPTLALACLYFSLELVESGAALSKARKWLIGTVFVMTIWFHFYGIFTLFFPLTFALSTKFRDSSFKNTLKYTIKFMSVVLCITMPLWLYSVFGPHLPRVGEDYGFSPFTYIPNPLENITGFLKAVLGNLVGRKYLYFLLIFMLTPFVLPVKEQFQQIAFLIILIILPIAFLLAIDVLHDYFFVQRQFIWVMPLFALFAGWSFDSFQQYAKDKINRRKP